MNESRQALPAYIRMADQVNATWQWIRGPGARIMAISGILSVTLIGLAWLIKLQLGTGLYWAFSIISFGLFAWAIYVASQMVQADKPGDTVSPDLRKLVFGQLASSAFGIIATATISMVDPGFSLLRPELPVLGVSVQSPKIFAQKARNAELPPETLGLNKQEGIASVGLSGFEGVTNHPQMANRAVTKATNWSTGLDEKAEQVILYRYFVRVFKDREGFNPKIYKDRKQYSIGFGSNANQLKKTNPGITVTKDQAYSMAMAELEAFKAKAKSDFPWLSYEQLWAITDQYYNAGDASIVGYKKVRPAGTMAPVMKAYQKDPNSVSYDQLYSAMVEAKDCDDCAHKRTCGHQTRAKYRTYLFLSKRSPKDWANFKSMYEKIVGGGIAGL